MFKCLQHRLVCSFSTFVIVFTEKIILFVQVCVENKYSGSEGHLLLGGAHLRTLPGRNPFSLLRYFPSVSPPPFLQQLTHVTMSKLKVTYLSYFKEK